MQVFRSYFKILNKHKGQMIMYMCIFIGIMSVLAANNTFKKNTDYETTKPQFAVFDYDDSVQSNALVEYLSEVCIRKEIKDDKKESMQDELFARNVNCVLIIKKGGSPDIVTIPDTRAATTFEALINSFNKMYDACLAAGYTPEDAVKAVKASLDKKVDVSLLGGKDMTAHSEIYYSFSYLGWLLIVLMILGVAPVLQVFSKKEIRERIQCSAYRFLNFNRELILGVVVTGLMVCVVLFIVLTLLFHGDTFSYAGGMYLLNMLCYMSVSLSLAFLLSKVTSNDQSLNMIANTFSLGMAFLCGVFVPEEFLPDNVIKVAHFLPAYWYNQAVKNIDFHLDSSTQTIFTCMGVQLLFAVAIILITLRISKSGICNSKA